MYNNFLYVKISMHNFNKNVDKKRNINIKKSLMDFLLLYGIIDLCNPIDKEGD